MNGFVLFAMAAAEASNPIQEVARTFGLNTHHFISQVISFSLVAFLLHRYAYKPILQVLDERKQRIADSLANTEKIKDELAKAEATRQEIMQRANQQANQLIAEARAAAAKVQETETQRAIATAEQIIAKAREASAQDHARMLAELRKEIGRLVVETTARVTGKVLTMDDQQRLIQETNKELAA